MSMYWKWRYFYFSATFSFHHLRIEPMLLLLLLLLFVYFSSISLNFFLSLVFFSFWFFFVAFCNCLFVRDTNKKERNSKNKCSCRAQLQCTQMCVKVATKLILCVVTRFKMLSVFGITGKWNVKREKKNIVKLCGALNTLPSVYVLYTVFWLFEFKFVAFFSSLPFSISFILSFSVCSLFSLYLSRSVAHNKRCNMCGTTSSVVVVHLCCRIACSIRW